MTKCNNYGTVLGCSNCLISLTSKDDISSLSALSIFSILLRLMDTPKSRTSCLSLNSIDIYCNAIIRIPKQSNTSICDEEIAWNSNKALCTSILENWLNNYNMSSATTTELWLIDSYTEEIRNSWTLLDLTMILREAVTKLEVIHI